MRSVDEVEALLRDKAAAAAINIRKSFRKADKDFSGAITYDEFKQMLAEMGLHLHDHDVSSHAPPRRLRPSHPCRSCSRASDTLLSPFHPRSLPFS